MSGVSDITALPQSLPVFPLAGVVLLPHVQLPLNIFEPRYVAMVDHALRHDRLIGMIQPRGEDGALFTTGCAGRLTSFQETGDGRYLITLTGLCRFDVTQELVTAPQGFRLVQPDWQRWAHDFAPVTDNAVCREKLLEALGPYLEKMQMSCDQWDAMRSVSCDKLVSTLTMICPFTAAEKQMLLEAPTLADRMKVLGAFLENALNDDDCCAGDDAPRCH